MDRLIHPAETGIERFFLHLLTWPGLTWPSLTWPGLTSLGLVWPGESVFLKNTFK